MDDVLKKRVSIGIAISCLVIAIGITVVTNLDRTGGGGKAGPIQMLCVNPACNNAFEATEDEFRKLMSGEDGAPPMPMMMMETPTFKCPKCNEKSVYVAMKCEKCGNVFVPNYQNPADYDKCSKCGFSKYQQEMPAEQEPK